MKKKHVIIAIIIVFPLNLWDVFFFFLVSILLHLVCPPVRST
jgi:hypothetical protein